MLAQCWLVSPPTLGTTSVSSIADILLESSTHTLTSPELACDVTMLIVFAID